MTTCLRAIRLFFAIAVLAIPLAVRAQTTPALGLRLGFQDDPGSDEIYLGLQTEFGKVLGDARFAPSFDIASGNGDQQTVANLDLRWYLFALPETGLRFFGAVGPGLLLSPDTDLGLNLTAGLHIPMKRGRRYNVELRFGFGDVPEFKVGMGVLFGVRR